MAGLQAGTILLLALWTLWLFVALPLLGDKGGSGVLAVFVLLALALMFTTHVTWRGYLMAWLTVHTLLAIAEIIADENWRQTWAVVVSLGGLLWLWGEGGWRYGHYVALTVAVLAIAAALVGLGFGSCWLFVARPLRQRADDAGRQANAAVRRASTKEYSFVYEAEQLAAVLKKHQGAEAASARRIAALEQNQRNQKDAYEQDQRTWERIRQRLLVALQEARRYRDLQHGPESDTEPSDGTADGTGQAAPADEVTVIRLRFSYVAERLPSQVTPTGRLAVPSPAASDRIRLVIEHSAVTMPRDQAGDVSEVLGKSRQARDDVTFRERFIDAASEYAGDRIGNNVSQVLTQRWITRDVAHVDAVSQALNRSDEWLHDLAGKPFEEAAGRLGVAQPGAAVLGGIGSELVLEPISAEIQGAVRCCEIIGIGVGLAFGLHPLAISCTKSLFRAQLNERLSTAIRDVFCDRDAITVDRNPPPARVTRSVVDDVSAVGLASPWDWDRSTRTDPAASLVDTRNRVDPRDREGPYKIRGPVDGPGSGRGLF